MPRDSLRLVLDSLFPHEELTLRLEVFKSEVSRVRLEKLPTK